MENIRSPEDILASLQSGNLKSGIFLVTGERGAGKTTWLNKLVSVASDASFQVKGLLSPGSFENGVKVAINLIALGSGEKRIMSTPVPQQLNAGKGKLRRLDTGELVLGGWQMHEDVLTWGNDLLYQLLTTPQPADNRVRSLLIIDELGPLEFNHGLGFTNAIKFGDFLNPNRLSSTQAKQDDNTHPDPVHLLPYHASFIVIRPDLLPRALANWPQAQILEINPSTR
ncbi:MAG TPA: nucleoside-triphosphatase [Anaerolineales bacterium]|nr:nucleoside-triphosphatase [Anaerolineales bacterium]